MIQELVKQKNYKNYFFRWSGEDTIMGFTYTEKELREFNIGDKYIQLTPIMQKKSFNCHNGFTPER